MGNDAAQPDNELTFLLPSIMPMASV